MSPAKGKRLLVWLVHVSRNARTSPIVALFMLAPLACTATTYAILAWNNVRNESIGVDSLVPSHAEFEHKIGVYADAQGNMALRGNLSADWYPIGTCTVRGLSFNAEDFWGLCESTTYQLSVVANWDIREIPGVDELSLRRIAETNAMSVHHAAVRIGLPPSLLMRSLRSEKGVVHARSWFMGPNRIAWLALLGTGAAIAMLWGLAWAPRIGWVGSWIRRAGVCPYCGYAADEGTKCSECGK